MKLLWNTIHVNNLEESIKFYENILNLKISKRFNVGPVEIAFLKAGEVEIELIKDKEGDNLPHSENISMGFKVDSITTMIEKIKSEGINIHSGPFEPTPHIKFFFIKDPNGVLIQLVEEIQ